MPEEKTTLEEFLEFAQTENPSIKLHRWQLQVAALIYSHHGERASGKTTIIKLINKFDKRR